MTTVTIPDNLAAQVDEVLKSQQMSREVFYTRAIEHYLKLSSKRTMDRAKLTAEANQLADSGDTSLPPDLAALSGTMLRKVKW